MISALLARLTRHITVVCAGAVGCLTFHLRLERTVPVLRALLMTGAEPQHLFLFEDGFLILLEFTYMY